LATLSGTHWRLRTPAIHRGRRGRSNLLLSQLGQLLVERLNFLASRASRLMAAHLSIVVTCLSMHCTSAFVFPGIDGCPLLLPLLTVRGAVDRAALGRTDEEGIGPWVRTAGSPESLAWLGRSISEVDSTHR
jgi:hypothetical protein